MRTFDKWGPYYKITLEIKPVQNPEESFDSGYHNLIHLTSGAERNAYGSRIPSVIVKGKVIFVRITNCDNCDNAHGGTGKGFKFTMNHDKWYTLQLEQRQTGPEASVFEFLVDGSPIQESEQVKESLETLNDQYENVKLYLSDPWFESALDMVEVKNILIWNGAGELNSNLLFKDCQQF